MRVKPQRTKLPAPQEQSLADVRFGVEDLGHQVAGIRGMLEELHR